MDREKLTFWGIIIAIIVAIISTTIADIVSDVMRKRVLLNDNTFPVKDESQIEIQRELELHKQEEERLRAELKQREEALKEAEAKKAEEVRKRAELQMQVEAQKAKEAKRTSEAEQLPLSTLTATFMPGTYEGKGRGYSEKLEITSKVTVDEEKITKVEIEGAEEEVPFGVPKFENDSGQLIDKTAAKRVKRR